VPDMPNWREFEKAGAESQRDVTRVYDDRYGHPSDKIGETKEKAPPVVNPHPLALE